MATLWAGLRHVVSVARCSAPSVLAPCEGSSFAALQMCVCCCVGLLAPAALVTM